MGRAKLAYDLAKRADALHVQAKGAVHLAGHRVERAICDVLQHLRSASDFVSAHIAPCGCKQGHSWNCPIEKPGSAFGCACECHAKSFGDFEDDIPF